MKLSENIIEDVSFVEVELIQEPFKVILEYIGEGFNGDYDPKDPNDVPLVRFSCFIKNLRDDNNNINPDWQYIDDTSYCTLLPVYSAKSTLYRAAGVIMENLISGYDDGTLKRKMESMSWLSPTDFDK